MEKLLYDEHISSELFENFTNTKLYEYFQIYRYNISFKTFLEMGNLFHINNGLSIILKNYLKK